MSSEKKTDLEKLRSSILNDLVPMIEGADIDPDQKFTLLLSSVRLTGDLDKFHKAHDVALKINDTTLKMDALMALLDEIDVAIADDESLAEELKATHQAHHPEHSTQNHSS